MNILTFDIEDWFHILDNSSTKTESQWRTYEPRIHRNVDRILDLLSEKKQKASFFCLGWIAEKYPEILKAIDMEGHEIGSHSHNHQLVYEQSPGEYREDLRKSIETLENIIGKKITIYRAPGFSLTDDCFWTFEIMRELGIETDCSIFPASRTHGGVADFKYGEPFLINVNGLSIKEFPMTFYSFFNKRLIFSGGGYFRLLPYGLIKRFARELDYVMTYFHPRDFDAHQPVIDELSFARRFRSYYGLGSSFKKLEYLLGDFTFLTLREASEKIDWDKRPFFEV
jgi:polysaccharide deacetylase family protein (PEP-CTERM system associated)